MSTSFQERLARLETNPQHASAMPQPDMPPARIEAPLRPTKLQPSRSGLLKPILMVIAILAGLPTAAWIGVRHLDRNPQIMTSVSEGAGTLSETIRLFTSYAPTAHVGGRTAQMSNDQDAQQMRAPNPPQESSE